MREPHSPTVPHLATFPIMHFDYMEFTRTLLNKERKGCSCRVYVKGLDSLLTFNTLPCYCSEFLTPYKWYLSYMQYCRSSQYCVVSTLLLCFLVNYKWVRTLPRQIYVAFWETGQILKIQDCLRNSRAVGAYVCYHFWGTTRVVTIDQKNFT